MSAVTRTGGSCRQTGMALPITLVLLAMTVMLGAAGLRAALTAERLSGNLKASVQAGMAAEAAAVMGWEALRGPDDMGGTLPRNSLESLTWEAFMDTSRFPSGAATGGGCAVPQRCAYRYLEDEQRRHLIVAMGVVVINEQVLASSEPVVVSVVFSRLAELFSRYALLADGEVVVATSATTQGVTHGNAVGSVMEPVSIPVLDSAVPEGAERLVRELDENGQPYCVFARRGDLAGGVFHCAGRLEVATTARFHNATLIASGDVHVAAPTGQEGLLDVAVLSGGNIHLDAPGTSRAWLMSAGDTYLATGTALEGAVIAHGDIHLSGRAVVRHAVGQPQSPQATMEKRLLHWQP